jgi:hypothetical protein
MRRLSASETNVLVVDSEPSILRLEEALLGERHWPCVVLSDRPDQDGPTLPLEELRSIVGPEAQIYLIAEHFLPRLRATLGRRLAVNHGMARIYWPGLASDSDEFDHPQVAVLDIEPLESTLAEFSSQFDFSRPHIRREIKRIEELRRMAEQKSAHLSRQLHSRQLVVPSLTARGELVRVAEEHLGDRRLSQAFLQGVILLASLPAPRDGSKGGRIEAAAENPRLAMSFLRGVMVLASLPIDGSCVREAEIKSALELPPRPLARLMRTLVALGLIERGDHLMGSYRLAQRASPSTTENSQ